jgi:hypothetical protein
VREKVSPLLQARDFKGLEELAGRETCVADILMQYIYEPGTLLYWRALEGLGRVAGVYPQQVKKLINRLLYLLNEDSGSTGWGAAAALGEIGRHRIELVEDIIPMFIGFLEESFSRKDMLWGIGRLAEAHPERLDEVFPATVPFLTDPDPQLRALAAWGVGKGQYRPAAAALQALQADEHPVEIYDRGNLLQATVGHVAREALATLD